MPLIEKQLLRFWKHQQRAFEVLTRDVCRNPRPERVHRLRVCIRRLRSELWILQRAAVKVKTSKLDRSLKRLGKQLGEIREFDVRRSDAKLYKAPLKGERKRRERQVKKLRHSLSRKKIKKQVEQLGAVAGQLKRHERLDVGKAAVQLAKLLPPDRKVQSRTDQTLHRLRVVFKKIRYAFEALGEPTGPLVNIQEELGRFHDLVILEGAGVSTKRLFRDKERSRSKALALLPSSVKFAKAHLQLQKTL